MLKSNGVTESQIWYPPPGVYDSGKNQLMSIYETFKNVHEGLKLHEKVNFEGKKRYKQQGRKI